MQKPLLLLVFSCVIFLGLSQEVPKVVLTPNSNNNIQTPETVIVATESQSEPQSVIATEPTYPINGGYTISKRAGEEQVLHDNNYYQSKIDAINLNIQAIDLKVNHVWNSSEKEEAETNGWFEQMYNTKQALLQERDQYQSLITN